MASNFDAAFDYVIGNEGAFSDDAADHGGVTYFGISEPSRRSHKCAEHPNGVRDEAFRAAGGRDLARHIYRLDYFKPFEGVRDQRLATKLFDIYVNVGDAVRVIQRAAGFTGRDVDGVFGEATQAALERMPTEQAIERLCLAVIDQYVDIARNDAFKRMRKHGIAETEIAQMQITFLKGWCRRAARRPPIVIKGV
jgi:lysozyme family protein